MEKHVKTQVQIKSQTSEEYTGKKVQNWALNSGERLCKATSLIHSFTVKNT